jgi:hypothetical protein
LVPRRRRFSSICARRRPSIESFRARSRGLSANFADDHAMLEHGMIMYDALYAWCRSQPEGTA